MRDAVLAYLLWGLLPVYWKLLGGVPAAQILAHRIVWSVVFLGGLVWLQPARRRALLDLLHLRLVGLLTLTGVLLGANWFVYIWAVNAGFVMEASLGYYITPLTSVLIGVLLFHEHLGPLSRVAVGVAAASVLAFTLHVGEMPWIALALAGTWSVYAALRKRFHLPGLEGLLVESLVLTPLALGWLLREELRGGGALGHQGAGTDLLLVLAGPATAIPLVLFTRAVPHVPLSTLGLLQYVAPTLQFLLAVLAYGEPLTLARSLLFGGIWVALILYSWETLRRR